MLKNSQDIKPSPKRSWKKPWLVLFFCPCLLPSLQSKEHLSAKNCSLYQENKIKKETFKCAYPLYVQLAEMARIMMYQKKLG